MPLDPKPVEDLHGACREMIRRKGTILWAGFMVDQEEGLDRAADWLSREFMAVEEIAMEAMGEDQEVINYMGENGG